jgi:hypothetical protein
LDNSAFCPGSSCASHKADRKLSTYEMCLTLQTKEDGYMYRSIYIGNMQRPRSSRSQGILNLTLTMTSSSVMRLLEPTFMQYL